MDQIVEAATRWGTTLVVPGLSSHHIAACETEMAAALAANPHRGAWFVGGVCADLSAALDPSDTWRWLRARLGRSTRGVPPPTIDGAIDASGAQFGEPSSALDILEPLFDDIWIDESCAPIALQIPAVSGAIIAFAADGANRCSTIVETTVQPHHLASVGLPSIRWLAWRLRETRSLSPLESVWARAGGSTVDVVPLSLDSDGPGGFESEIRTVLASTPLTEAQTTVVLRLVRGYADAHHVTPPTPQPDRPVDHLEPRP